MKRIMDSKKFLIILMGSASLLSTAISFAGGSRKVTKTYTTPPYITFDSEGNPQGTGAQISGVQCCNPGGSRIINDEKVEMACTHSSPPYHGGWRYYRPC